MKCMKCGAELASEAKFCNVCGEPVPQGGETLAVETPQPIVQTQEVTTEGVIIGPVEPVTEALTTPAPVLGPVTELQQPTTEPVTSVPIVVEPVTEAVVVSTTPVVEPITEVTTTPVVEASSEAAPQVAPAAPQVTPTAPATPVQPQVSAPKKSNVGVVVAVVALVVIAVIGGIFVGKNFMKDKDEEDDDNPSVETISTKTNISFAGMEFELSDDYDYYYDTLQSGTDCLVIDISNDLELIVYDTGYSYYTFENAFDQIVSENYSDAITTIKKPGKYAFVNYKLNSEGVEYYFYDGVTNTKALYGLGTIIAKTSSNLEDKDFNKAMDIINTAKKSRSIDRSLEEGNKLSSIDEQSLITSYVTEEEVESE